MTTIQSVSSTPPGNQADALRLPTAARAGLWTMAIFSLVAGLQQQFAPRSFFDDFPGFGRQWVAVHGPYNEHLVRDLGGANLAIALVIFVTIAQPTIGLVRGVAAAMVVAQIPHFIYHAVHLGLLRTLVDQVLQTISLAMVLIVPTVVLIGTFRVGTGPDQRSHDERATIGGDVPARRRLINSTEI